MVFRIIRFNFSNPAENLAAEESAAISAQQERSPPTLLFWSNQNSVILGKFQCWKQEVSLDSCKNYNTFILRRFSGGGAVYHDQGNLNISIIIPLEKNKPIIESFRIQKAIHQILVDSIRNLVDQTELIPEGGLHIAGQKISGFAGVIKKGLVFSHYTLLINVNLKVLSEVLKVTKDLPKGCVKSRHWPVQNLNHYCGKQLDRTEIIKSFSEEFELRFEISLEEGSWSNYEFSERNSLLQTKHSNPHWIFQR